MVEYMHPHESVRYSDKKSATLDKLRSPKLLKEVINMRERGYDISIGDTDDEAYDSPERIESTLVMLDDLQEKYEVQMGRFDVGRQAILTTVRFGAPAPSARNWAKRRLSSREQVAEQLRNQLLYKTPEVDALPWHEQGGKALALGTIVDAHDLVTPTSQGKYENMSGRLDEVLSESKFSDNAGWLSGKTLRDAIIAAEQRFKKRSLNDATEKADEEIARLLEFTTAPSTDGFKEIVAYCTDSLGIRSRKEEVRKAINDHVETSDKNDFLMMSVGCGTALPMLEVMHDFKTKGIHSRLLLLDQDPIALAAAHQFASDMGLDDSIEIHCEQLFHGSGRKTRLLSIEDSVLKGRKLDVCEDSGLREYFPDFLYRDLTSQAWDSLNEGGIMTTGNMNKNRPQQKFLHGLMGWPIPVQMRKISDIAELHEKAGVPKSQSRLRVTQDGVYTLCFSVK